MKNIKFIFLVALVSMALCVPVWSLETKAESQADDPVPVAEIAVPEYRFDAVPEGTKVTHAYVIKNKGTALLEVVRVKTG
ncbi:hypothetical protein [Desulfocicer niacini]